jgi:hypothetical protein
VNAIAKVLLAGLAWNVATTHAQAGPPAAATVTLDGPTLSATVHEASPGALLAALARGTGARISARHRLPEVPLSASLAGVEAVHGLARLLDGASYVLVYGAAAADGGPGDIRLVEIRVLSWPGRNPSPRGTAPPRPPEADRPAPRLSPAPGVLQHEALGAPRAEHRAEALQALAYLGDEPRARPTLEQALADTHEAIRARALELIKDTVDGVPFDALARMAHADPSPQLRAAALALLAERTDTAAVRMLRLGLGDPDAEVRAHARALLDDLHVDTPARAPLNAGRW